MSDYRLHYRGDIRNGAPARTPLVDAYGYPLRVDGIDYDPATDTSTMHLSIDVPEGRAS